MLVTLPEKSPLVRTAEFLVPVAWQESEGNRWEDVAPAWGGYWHSSLFGYLTLLQTRVVPQICVAVYLLQRHSACRSIRSPGILVSRGNDCTVSQLPSHMSWNNSGVSKIWVSGDSDRRAV